MQRGTGCRPSAGLALLSLAVVAAVFTALTTGASAEAAWVKAEPRRGRDALRPWDVPPRGWIDVGWRVLFDFNADRHTFIAGGVAFFFLLGMFPALSAFVALYGLFAEPGTAARPLALLSGLAPPVVLDFLVEQVSRLAASGGRTNGAALALSVAASLWSANAGVKTLIYGLNVASHEAERRSYLRYTAATLVVTAAALVFALAAGALMLAAPMLKAIAGPSGLLTLMERLRWPGFVALELAALVALYRFGPCRARPRVEWVIPGVLLAGAGLLALAAGFSRLVGLLGDMERTYGALAAVIGFMVWTWWSVIVILVGAAFNAELEHQTAKDTTDGPAKPLGARGALVADTLGPRAGAPGLGAFTQDGGRALIRKLLIRRSRRGARRG